MTGEVPPEVAERHYERWVMRVAESITGFRPDSIEEAEVALLLRLEEGMIGRISPRRYFEPEEVPENHEEYLGAEGDENPADAARSLEFALYEAVGGEEWPSAFSAIKTFNLHLLPPQLRAPGGRYRTPPRVARAAPGPATDRQSLQHLGAPRREQTSV